MNLGLSGRTQWLSRVSRDPVPWLLDPANPSARFLTLRDIFRKSASDLSEEQQFIVSWEPVQALLEHWNATSFWGRADNPYFGGPVGNLGVLYLLYQLGAPALPQVQAACRNLLDLGRTDDGRFALPEPASASWLCYTGMALQLLNYFGFQDDVRVRSTRVSLLQAILLRPDLLACPLLGGRCLDGLVKALGALLSVPPNDRTADDVGAIGLVGQYLVDYPLDLDGRDRRWLAPVFPRYYSGDLLELCHLLAQTPYRDHIRLEELVRRILLLQDEEGRWIKAESTPAFTVERIHQPSRWLTLEAVHTLTLIYGDMIYAPGRSA